MNDTVVIPRRPNKEVRRPFGAQVQKLAYEARKGFHRHWFNDEPGRLEQAVAAGYTHVEDREGKKVSRPVGVNTAGGPQIGYLMEIPQEWYDEDMAAQQKRVDEVDDSIKRGAVSGSPGVDGRYIPANRGITIRQGSGSGGT